jgi:hypothetical protein
MEEPGSWVISGEANSDLIAVCTKIDDIPTDRVNIVVYSATSTPNNAESVLQRVQRQHIDRFEEILRDILTPCIWKGC